MGAPQSVHWASAVPVCLDERDEITLFGNRPMRSHADPGSRAFYVWDESVGFESAKLP